MKMMKILLLTITFFTISQLSSQAWTPVGNGLNMPNSGVSYPKGTEANGSQYVAYVDSNQINVAKWNGLSWNAFPSLTINRSFLRVYDLEILPNEDLYLSVDIGRDSGAVYQFTNGAWSRLVQNDFFGGVIDLLYDSDSTRLYMAGEYVFNNPVIEDVGYFENGNFTNLPVIYAGGFDSIVSLSLISNELVASGIIDGFVSDTIPARVFRSGKWEKLASIKKNFTGNFGYGLKTFSEGGNTYLLTATGQIDPFISLYEIKSDSIYLRDGLIFGVNDYIRRASFTSTSSNGYYFSATEMGVMRVQSGNLTLFANTPARVSSVSSLNNTLFYYATDTAVNTQLYPPNNYAYSTQTNFARVSGIMFLDQNSNCAFDVNEMPVSSGLLSLTQGATAVTFSSNSQGRFSSLVLAGTYNFALPINISRSYLRLNSSCNLPSSISLSANQNFQQDIALEHDGSVDALIDVESYTGQATYGFTENYKIAIQNPGIAVSGLITVELTLPGTLSFVSSTPQSTSVTGNKHTFTFNSLAMFEEKAIQLQLKTDTAGNSLGDTLCLYAQINGVTGDVNLINNYDTLCLEVRGAYDPNDKTASAEQVIPGTKKVDYRIRFQNTGNSPAVKVTVVDTLDLTLPITAIIMNSASHPYSISVQNNILIWEFDNIMLPDSASDPLGSQGYISFSAGLNPALGLGDIIFNDADIYFDYQKPIITNKAKTVIVQNISILENELEQLVEVFPNPAKEKLFIKWKGEKTAPFWLIDAQGKQVKQFEIDNTQPFELNVQELPVGIYFIKSPHSTYKLLVQ